MTRFEKIKTLNINEMASFLSDIQWDSNEPGIQEMYEFLIQECSTLSKEMSRADNGEIIF